LKEDLQYEGINVQVVVQGKNNESVMFFIDGNGIIKSIKQINAHQNPAASDHNNVSGATLAQHEFPRIENQVA